MWRQWCDKPPGLTAGAEILWFSAGRLNQSGVSYDGFRDLWGRIFLQKLVIFLIFLKLSVLEKCIFQGSRFFPNVFNSAFASFRPLPVLWGSLFFGGPSGPLTMKIMYLKFTSNRAPRPPKWSPSEDWHGFKWNIPRWQSPKQRHGEKIGYNVWISGVQTLKKKWQVFEGISLQDHVTYMGHLEKQGDKISLLWYGSSQDHLN